MGEWMYKGPKFVGPRELQQSIFGIY